MIPNRRLLCTNCNQKMDIITMREVSVIVPQPLDVAFICEKCGQTVLYPTESRLFP